MEQPKRRSEKIDSPDKMRMMTMVVEGRLSPSGATAAAVDMIPSSAQVILIHSRRQRTCINSMPGRHADPGI